MVMGHAVSQISSSPLFLVPTIPVATMNSVDRTLRQMLPIYPDRNCPTRQSKCSAVHWRQTRTLTIVLAAMAKVAPPAFQLAMTTFVPANILDVLAKLGVIRFAKAQMLWLILPLRVKKSVAPGSILWNVFPEERQAVQMILSRDALSSALPKTLAVAIHTMSRPLLVEKQSLRVQHQRSTEVLLTAQRLFARIRTYSPRLLPVEPKIVVRPIAAIISALVLHFLVALVATAHNVPTLPPRAQHLRMKFKVSVKALILGGPAKIGGTRTARVCFASKNSLFAC